MQAENLTSVTEFILGGLSDRRKTQLLLFVIILLIYSATVTGNLLVILLVRTDTRLQTPMYFFLSHLSGVEISYVTSTVPQMLAHLLAGKGAISRSQCAAQMYMILSMGGTECFLLSIMAYDRYLAICHPLMYTVVMGQWRQLQLASACWAGGFIIGMINVNLTFSLPFCGPNFIDHFVCELPAVLKLACADTRVTEAAVFVASVLALLIPISVILISYGLILASILQRRSTAGQRKAFSTCASHLVVVTLFYGTLMFMYMRPQSDSDPAPDRDKHIAFFYIVVTPMLNPVIYTLRNKDVHAAAAKVLGIGGFKKC